MALFLFELRRLTRSPLLWVPATLTAIVCTLWNRNLAFDLSTETIEIPTVMLILAAGTAYAACLATSRDQRHGMPSMLGALPVRADRRTTAVLQAASLAAGAMAALVTATYLLGRWVVAGPAVGRFDPFEALTGVAVAAFAAALGTAAARWIPTLFAAPLAIAFGAFLQIAASFLWSLEPGGGWLAPVNPMMDLPEQAALRPSGWHLIYVAALAVLLGTAALLKHGAHQRRVVAAIAAAVVAVSSAVVATQRGSSDAGSSVPTADRCQNIQDVRYCAYPDYTAWIPEWARAVRPVIDAAPPAVRDRVTQVRQSPGGSPAPEQTIHADTVWGETFRSRLTGEAAVRLVGLSPRPRAGSRLEEARCDASGQARTVVALWLMAQGSPLEHPAHRTELGFGIEAGESEVAYARQLLTAADTGERIRANWATLTHPKTTTEQALPLLGLRREAAGEGSELAACI